MKKRPKYMILILLLLLALSAAACGGRTGADANKTEASAAGTKTGEDATADAPEIKDDALGFEVALSKTFPNDTTGNWRLARISAEINIEEYAADYYKNYFENDNEVHIIFNSAMNTSTKITNMGGVLDVMDFDYVDGEEKDASLACGGILLAEFHVDLKSGRIEKVQ